MIDQQQEQASTLQSLKAHSKIVADTGDFEEISKYSPIDSTTNPSLILKAAQLSKYAPIVKKALNEANFIVSEAIDKLQVAIGLEILKLIPGRLSVEVDARVSADTEATVQKALKIIGEFERSGIPKERILIKIASTWEGIQAAKILESIYGIHCNMTLIFNFEQAVACGNAKVTLISPFVGRILDWYSKETGKSYSSFDDPGVEFVKKVYYYFKCFGITTEIMGASFRNIGEIMELAGLDCITISPNLLENLSSTCHSLTPKLSIQDAKSKCHLKSPLSLASKKAFESYLANDAAASALLPAGISKFCQDTEELERFLENFIKTTTTS